MTLQQVKSQSNSSSLRHNIDAYLDCVDRNNRHDLSSVLPFMIDGKILGYITKGFGDHLSKDYPDAFLRTPSEITFSPEISTFEERTAFFDTLLDELLLKGLIEKPRDEYYAIAENFGDTPLFKIKRGASPYFGFKNYGLHLNAYVKRPDGLYMWIAKRSGQKNVAPHKLDQMVAGGQPYGLSIAENLEKESFEEAHLLPEQLAEAKSVGVLRYRRQTGYKFRRDYIFTYDLELTDDFFPQNNDGEVDSFQLMSLQEIISHLEAPDDFKFNSALVIIDFFIRHGIIKPDEPGYFNLTQRLYA